MNHDSLRPRKSLGQNFLRDDNIARKIVAALECRATDRVVEIGPGEGALTTLLLAEPIKRLNAAEYDSRAVALLRRRFLGEERFVAHETDVLKTSIEALDDHGAHSPGSLKVVGNIPYYITSDILFWIFDNHAALLQSGQAGVERAVIMIQKEVAARIVAKPRSKEYGTLSLAAAFISEPRIAFHVSPNCFYPKPSVTSSVLIFNLREEPETARIYKTVQPLVREAFNQRRKTLWNALKQTLGRSAMSSEDILELARNDKLPYFRQRAEELTAADFVTLYNFLKDCGCY